jgi:FtsZ-binding cell division protein ZapB
LLQAHIDKLTGGECRRAQVHGVDVEKLVVVLLWLLQAHIDELTGEKLELMRGLQQQAKANEALAEENRALGEQLNALSGKAGVEEAVMKRMQVRRYTAAGGPLVSDTR